MREMREMREMRGTRKLTINMRIPPTLFPLTNDK